MTTQTPTPGPIYGLNGSNLTSLFDDTRTALDAVRAALSAVQQVGPSPRDFLHLDAGGYGDTYAQARDTHTARLHDLDRVYEYVESLAVTMADQLDQRGGGR